MVRVPSIQARPGGRQIADAHPVPGDAPLEARVGGRGGGFVAAREEQGPGAVFVVHLFRRQVEGGEAASEQGSLGLLDEGEGMDVFGHPHQGGDGRGRVDEKEGGAQTEATGGGIEARHVTAQQQRGAVVVVVRPAEEGLYQGVARGEPRRRVEEAWQRRQVPKRHNGRGIEPFEVGQRVEGGKDPRAIRTAPKQRARQHHRVPHPAPEGDGGDGLVGKRAVEEGVFVPKEQGEAARDRAREKPRKTVVQIEAPPVGDGGKALVAVVEIAQAQGQRADRRQEGRGEHLWGQIPMGHEGRFQRGGRGRRDAPDGEKGKGRKRRDRDKDARPAHGPVSLRKAREWGLAEGVRAPHMVDVKDIHIKPKEAPMTTSTPFSPAPAPRLWDQAVAFPAKAQAWLDGHGRKAWIGLSVLALIAFWPAAIALAAYTGITGRWDKGFYRTPAVQAGASRAFGGAYSVANSSGNATFDAYKAEMLKRLEDEQAAFESFLSRLRAAKDQQEFDAFMADRVRTASGAAPAASEPAPVERVATVEADPVERKGFAAV